MQSHNASESNSAVRIKTYLSYRQKNPQNLSALEFLKQHCSAQSIDLIYDQEALYAGQSIKRFMDELGSARCVFIFLTPDYFESAYTLYELVTIDQWADMDVRFVFPMRISNDVTAYSRTAIQTFWEKVENKAIRDELANLLETSHGAAWSKVVDAWDNIIKPYLGIRNDSLEFIKAENQSKFVEEFVLAAKSEFMSAIQEENKKLQSKIIFEIADILKKNLIPLDLLAKEIMPVSVTAEAIAQKMITQVADRNAIAVLTNAIREQKKSKNFNEQQWEACHNLASQIGGWLLINSIDPFWWFNHQLKMQQLATKSVSRTYALIHQPYVEVIVSRTVLRDARFQLDKEGKAQPANNGYEIPFFDGVSEDAIATQLLYPIYQDLHQSPNESSIRLAASLTKIEPPSELNRLLNGIKNRAIVRFDSFKKPIYYLMSKETLQLIEKQDWYPVLLKDDLPKYLQFVSFEKNSVQNIDQPHNNQELLIEQYALLLSMK